MLRLLEFFENIFIREIEKIKIDGRIFVTSKFNAILVMKKITLFLLLNFYSEAIFQKP